MDERPGSGKISPPAGIRMMKLLVESVVWFCKLTMVAVTIIVIMASL